MAKTRRFDSGLMGEMHEGRLLLSLSVPMMLSMLVQALYNVVDSIYVAQVSEDCLSALSLAFPAQNIMIGLGTGTGVGVSTLVSRALGAGNRKHASRVAGIAIFLSGCCWLLMALFGLFGVDVFIHSQTDIPEKISIKLSRNANVKRILFITFIMQSPSLKNQANLLPHE